ncbi:MAG: hypothetical protein ACR2IP_10410 [Solirubrobacteraceae bacterium]
MWAVVTDPAYVKQWQYGTVLSTDWAVDSPIRFTSEWEGKTRTSGMNRGLCHRSGSGGQSPPRASIASAIAA